MQRDALPYSEALLFFTSLLCYLSLSSHGDLLLFLFIFGDCLTLLFCSFFLSLHLYKHLSRSFEQRPPPSSLSFFSTIHVVLSDCDYKLSCFFFFVFLIPHSFI